MKRTILYTVFTAASFAAGVTGSSALDNRKVTVVADGEFCWVSQGISGYMVSSGLVPECVADGNS